MTAQTDIFEMMMRYEPPAKRPPELPHADGVTYSAEHDRLRLATVLGCVFRALEGGKRWTLHELTEHCERELGRHVSQTSVSAKLRDLRKVAIGGFDVRSERIDGGTWSYWMERKA